jgi:hypothetical protein
LDGESLMAVRVLHRSFSAGEITPELFGRIDLTKRQEGLALCRNFITLPHGPATNRPGTEFVRPVKTSANVTRVIPFSYNNTQTFVVEVGAGYFRWHTNAATLLYSTPAAYNGATAYTVGSMASSGGVNYYRKVVGFADGVANAANNGAGLVRLTLGVFDQSFANGDRVLVAGVGGVPGANGEWVVSNMSMVGFPPVTVFDLVGSVFSGVYSGGGTASNNVTPGAAGSAKTWYAMPSAPNIYEIPNPYAAADLMDLHYVQSADVLTITHPNYPPMELRRYGATDWRTALPSFAPPANPLTGVTATATGVGAVGYTYVVTAVRTEGLEETVASGAASCTNNLATAGNVNTITFADSSTAGTNVRYYIYKLSNGLYGYIGQSGSGSFVDNNITADVSKTPPISDASSGFNAAGGYPAAVSYYQQRRLFGGTANAPQNLWATRSGTESNMSYTIPVQSDNRIAVRIAAREASAIRHIVPAGQLLLLTATCEWKCGSSSGDVLTPTSISITPQSYNGASNVVPVVVNNIVLYAAARGGHIRELSYSWQASSYVSGDISLMAPHLFDYNTIVDMTYSRGPVPVLWAISSNGLLLGLTYVPEQQVSAWHRHDTGASGVFESCCVITENNEDMLYLVVKRTINGATTRFIERLHTRLFATLADAFFVDCGSTYSGEPTRTVTGLTWLEGQTVNILGDGATFPPQVVTGGAIAIDQPCSKITVGLPIVAQLQTLPVATQSDGGAGQGRVKNVNKIWMRVVRSSGISAGPDFNSLDPVALRTTESYGSPPNLVSDEIEMVLNPSWAAGGQVCIEQTDPLPLDLTSMTLEVALGN